MSEALSPPLTPSTLSPTPSPSTSPSPSPSPSPSASASFAPSAKAQITRAFLLAAQQGDAAALQAHLADSPSLLSAVDSQLSRCVAPHRPRATRDRKSVV